MKMRLISCAAALVLAAAPVHAAPADAGAERVVDAFHDALTNGDAAAALSCLDDTVQIYEQGWVEHTKADYASAHLPADVKFAAATKSSRTARSADVVGDLAYVSSEGRTTGSFEGKPVNSITLETMILRRTDSGWRIVHIHWSSRKPS